MRRPAIRALLVYLLFAMAIAVVALDVHNSSRTGTIVKVPVVSGGERTIANIPPQHLVVGTRLSATNGTWSQSVASYTYAWKDCDSNGANCSTAAGSPTNQTAYTVVTGDIGSTIEAWITATFVAGGTATAQSAATGVVSDSGGSLTAFNDPMTGSAIAQGPNQWVAVDNTIGNTNTTQCDLAANGAETGGNIVLSLTSGSYTCLPTTSTVAGEEIHPRDQAFEYGTLTVTAKMAGSQGAQNNAWPAIWMLGSFCQHPAYLVAGADPAPCNWPTTGSEEVDLTDMVPPSSNYSSINSKMFTQTAQAGVACSGVGGVTDEGLNFHTYQLVWTASSIVTKIDGGTQCTFTTNLPTSVLFPILTLQMQGGTTIPTNSHEYFNSFTIVPAGPDIANSANWPSISGSLVHGNVLTAAPGTWTGSPTAYHYQWLQCNSSGAVCSPITTGSCSSTWMACGSTYTTVSGDTGHTIQVLVQADNASGKTQYGSNVTGAIS